MTRPRSLWLCSLIAFSAAQYGCGSADTGLFSPGGMAEGGGTHVGGGGSSAAGAPANGGSDGSVSGGGGAAGNGSGASAGRAEGGAAGSSAGGAGASGAAGQAHAGTDAGGSSGSSGAGGGHPGAGAAGGGSSGQPGSGGSSGSGGSGGASCTELLALAKTQLAAAQGCDAAANAQQCSGSVSNLCGCAVPVQRDDSPETKAYLATRKEMTKNHCSQICPAVACMLFTNAQCSAPGSSTVGTCSATHGPLF